MKYLFLLIIIHPVHSMKLFYLSRCLNNVVNTVLCLQMSIIKQFLTIKIYPIKNHHAPSSLDFLYSDLGIFFE